MSAIYVPSQIGDIQTLSTRLQSLTLPHPVISKLQMGLSDVVITVMGDSTGNATDEWVYLTTQWLADNFPAYTVNYYLWSDGSQAYGTVEVIQTGSGAQTLTIYNASHPGASYDYFYNPATTRLQTILSTSTDLTIISLGYNSSGTTYALQASQVAEIVKARVPSSFIAFNIQPPRNVGSTDYSDNALRMVDLRKWATLEGYGIIDVQKAYVAYGDWSSLISGDDLHPNSAGSIVWADQVKKFLALEGQYASPVSTPSIRDSITIPAKAFDSLTGTPAYGITNSHQVWELPDGSLTAILAEMIDVPRHWKTVDVWLAFFSTVTSGNVYFIPRYGSMSNLYGNVTNAVVAPSAVSPTTTAASSSANLVRFVNVQANMALPAGRPLNISFTRDPTNAADTMAGSAYVCGLVLMRRS